MQEHKVDLGYAERWHTAISLVVPIVQNQAGKNVVDAVNALHDVATGVNLVMRNAEAIIADLPGDATEEKIDNAAPHLRALLASVQLMNARLKMPSFATNPASASFGQKHRTPVHKVFFKMVRLFDQAAAKKKITLRMVGSSTATPLCFDSFGTIALVLIDNAIKYSIPGKTVTVSVNDKRNRTVRVSVESDGPPVPEDMCKTIFDAGVRTPAAVTFASTGSGLGLYIAKVVADAHDFGIIYACTGTSPDGKTGHNEFCFDVPF